jgi:hypothetical protein
MLTSRIMHTAFTQYHTAGYTDGTASTQIRRSIYTVLTLARQVGSDGHGHIANHVPHIPKYQHFSMLQVVKARRASRTNSQ